MWKFGCAVDGIVQDIRGSVRRTWNEYMGYDTTEEADASISDTDATTAHRDATKRGIFESTSSLQESWKPLHT